MPSNEDVNVNLNSATASVAHDEMTEEEYKILMGTLREVGNPLTFSHNAATSGLPPTWIPSSVISGVSTTIDETDSVTPSPQSNAGTRVSKAMQRLLGSQTACNTRQDWEERRTHRRRRLIVGRDLREVVEHEIVKGGETGENSRGVVEEVGTGARDSQLVYQQGVRENTCFLLEPSPLQEIQVFNQAQSTVDNKELFGATATLVKETESEVETKVGNIISRGSPQVPSASAASKTVFCVIDSDITSGIPQHPQQPVNSGPVSRASLHVDPLHFQASHDPATVDKVDLLSKSNREGTLVRKLEETSGNVLEPNITNGVSVVKEVDEMKELSAHDAKLHHYASGVYQSRSFRLTQTPTGTSTSSAGNTNAETVFTAPFVASGDSHEKAMLEQETENPRRHFRLCLSNPKQNKDTNYGEKKEEVRDREILNQQGDDLTFPLAAETMAPLLEVSSTNTGEFGQTDNKGKNQNDNGIDSNFSIPNSSILLPPRRRTLSLGFNVSAVEDKESNFVNNVAGPSGSSTMFSPYGAQGSQDTGVGNALVPATAITTPAKMTAFSPVYMTAPTATCSRSIAQLDAQSFPTTESVQPTQPSGILSPSSPISTMLRMITPTPTPSIHHSATDTPCRRHRVTRVPLPSVPPKIDISMIKRVLEDHYELNRKISEGVYGVVYIGTDKRTNDMVALKRLKVLRGLDGFPYTSLREVIALQHINRQRARLAKEAIRGESSEHPLTVKNDRQEVHSSGARAEEDPLKEMITLRDVLVSREGAHDIFLVFNYASSSVAGLLARHFPFVLPEIAYIFRSLVIAAKKLHAMGIIHRDIKSDNVLLMRDGVVKLTDFGLCAFEDSGRAALTPSMINLSYRPPEMLLGSVIYNTKVDVWSIGCFLAQIFLRHPPFYKRRSADEQERATRYSRSSEIELEQLALIAEVLGPITQVSSDAFPAETCSHLKHLQKIKERIDSGSTYGTYSKLFSNSSPSTVRLEALFEPSFLYTQYGGFRRWFIAEMENRRVEYTRRWQSSSVLAPSSSHSPQPPLLLPSPACLDVLCSIFQYDPRCRPTATQLLGMPFFELLDDENATQLGFVGSPQNIPYPGRFSSLNSNCFDDKRVGNERELKERLERVQSGLATKLQGFHDSHIKPKS